MQATTAGAYRAHIYGAARLLEITGPGECAHGVLCQLFYHVRTQILFVQVAMDGYNVPLSAKKILSDTLLYKDSPMIQKLMCCITALHDLRAWNDRSHESLAEDHGDLELQVDQLWVAYSAQKSISRATETGPFSDAFTALTVTYFSAAYILLAILSFDSRDIADFSRHSEVILDAAIFLDTTRNAVAYMRMATPLLLVALYAQCREHHESAIDMFEVWSREYERY